MKWLLRAANKDNFSTRGVGLDDGGLGIGGPNKGEIGQVSLLMDDDEKQKRRKKKNVRQKNKPRIPYRRDVEGRPSV